jgi:hypothetical protein
VHCQHHRYFEPGRVQPEAMVLLPPLLGDVAILDLEPVLVGGSVSDLLMAGREGVDQRTVENAVAVLDDEMERSEARPGITQASSASSGDGIDEELAFGPALHAVDAEIVAS